MLEQNALYVWRIRLDSAFGDGRIAPWRKLLSREELLKADGFHAGGHRRDYVMAHGALRVVLGGYLGIDPAAVRLAVRPPAMSGELPAAPSKPGLWAAGGDSEIGTDLRFNLSHTAGAALIAVVLGREVGVDVERNRPLDNLDAMAHTIFSEEELALWSGLAEADRLGAFYRVWTRKEAYLKAIGLGLYRVLQDVTVPISASLPDEPSHAEMVRDRSGSGRWLVSDIAVEPGCCAAVCWEGDGLERIVVTDLEFEDLA